jgi:DNA invertase Pin-like site-specific DNA recombinase
MIKGYARVSTDGQTLEAQQQALQEAGAAQVFAGRGPSPDRPRGTLDCHSEELQRQSHDDL